jgi:DNA polymerase-3 subunit delta
MAKRSAKRSTSTKPAKLDASVRIAIIHGQEEMLKRLAFQELRGALEAAHGEMEPVYFDGKTASLAEVLDELRTFSLMQSHKLVVVEDADAFVSTHREALQRYATVPVDSATLVLRSVNWRPGNLDKAVAKVGAKATCKPLSVAEAAKWLVDRAETEHKRTLSRDAANALVERLGVDLMRLDSELGKLAVMVGDDDTIDRDLIDLLVGKSSDEQAWSVQEAVLEALTAGRGGRRSGTAAGGVIEKVHELVDLAGQSEVLVSYAIIDMARKLHQGAVLKAEGLPEGQIARRLRLFGPRQSMFSQVLRNVSPCGASRLFDRAVEMDRRGKTGLGDLLQNLECFSVLLADEVQ